MARLLEEVCTAALGKYRDFDFVLYEEDDHIVTVEHYPCGFKDRFVIHQDLKIEALQNACKDHLIRSHGYDEDSL